MRQIYALISAQSAARLSTQKSMRRECVTTQNPHVRSSKSMYQISKCIRVSNPARRHNMESMRKMHAAPPRYIYISILSLCVDMLACFKYNYANPSRRTFTNYSDHHFKTVWGVLCGTGCIELPTGNIGGGQNRSHIRISVDADAGHHTLDSIAGSNRGSFG